MPATITEKILARAAGLAAVAPGDSIRCRPDLMMAYDFPGATDVLFNQVETTFGLDRVKEPERYVLFIDHLDTDRDPAKEAAFHDVTRRWAKRNGVALHEGAGIGHQVAAELGYARPGTFVLHIDGHISGLGAFGCLAMGVRREILEPWLTGAMSLDVPPTIQFILSGGFADGVDSRDLLHRIIAELGPDGCLGHVMEFDGSGARDMSLGLRQGLCGMAMFTGALTAIFNPDPVSLAFASERSGGASLSPLASDPDAVYASTHHIALDSIAPQVVLPGSAKASNTRDVAEVTGVEVRHGYIGSCASGRLEDLRAAARVLEGRRVADGFRLKVIPTSEAIRQQAQREGLLDILESAGAYVGPSSCDFCYGYADPLASGDACISTGVLNIAGRMGSTDAQIYMASAYTVAAAAVNGQITDPRDLIDSSYG